MTYFSYRDLYISPCTTCMFGSYMYVYHLHSHEIYYCARVIARGVFLYLVFTSSPPRGTTVALITVLIRG